MSYEYKQPPDYFYGGQLTSENKTTRAAIFVIVGWTKINILTLVSLHPFFIILNDYPCSFPWKGVGHI